MTQVKFAAQQSVLYGSANVVVPNGMYYRVQQKFATGGTLAVLWSANGPQGESKEFAAALRKLANSLESAEENATNIER